MVTIHEAALALLILQIYVSAAPSEVIKPEVSRIENEEPKLDTPPSIVEANKDSSLPENQRQKRFYNPYGFGFPPISPIQYPTYNKRDQESDLGIYGIDDPLTHIHKRLQEIASVARQPAPPLPPPVHFPLYFPVIFVPQFGCNCNPNQNNPPRPTAKPDRPQPTTNPPIDGGTTSPDILNRWPEMEDERQNWGLVMDDKDAGDYDIDFNRPISFDPIVLNTTNLRPAPPVEHGSSQGGADNSGPSTTTVRPRPSNNRPNNNRPNNSAPSPPLAIAPPADASGYPQSSAETPQEAPTTCDGAVLSCCHQPEVTYSCFSILGCPDPTSYGNPCDPLVILRVIGKYQKFYGVRNG